MKPVAEVARTIFAEALQRVDVRRAVLTAIGSDTATLTLGDAMVPLVELDELLIVAIGKAAVPMYAAAVEALGEDFPCSFVGIVVAPSLTLLPLRHAALYAGAHPTPDIGSVQAALAVEALLERAGERTAVLFLISGGGSAMVERPLDPGVSVDDLAAFYVALVHSGLKITEINALRKHFSAVKGGRLAKAAAGARVQSTLLISDVPHGALDAISSGLTLPDTTTTSDCEALLPRLRASAALPANVEEFFKGPLFVETPKLGDSALQRAQWREILSSESLVQAARESAEQHGFRVVVDNTCDDWEYREAAHYLLDRSAEVALEAGPTCLISVGEVAVTLPPAPGEGGRNQQFALTCAAELARRGQQATVLSAGSDGVDGRSNAAGAICNHKTVDRAEQAGHSVEIALAGFDSAPLLRALGEQIVIGPTGNNLRDLRLVLTS